MRLLGRKMGAKRNAVQLAPFALSLSKGLLVA